MCGFVGFYNRSQSQDKAPIVKQMNDTIVHRGPDSEGYFTDDSIALGFRRLSIIDLSEVAAQPMYNETKDIVMVFNGEIYNYQEIYKDLVEKGHVFRSHTDSEVILHGYESYGVKILDKLRGMFAIALWDMKKEALFIARDLFGIKPLYYTQATDDGALLFGSEIKSFLKYPGFQKEFNEQALKPYLSFQYSVMDETFFKGVYKLKPAHYMWIQNGEMAIRPYAEKRFKMEPATFADNVAAVEKLMESSVEHHRMSDVPVGSFLSGGVDSSYITALLNPNKTFSVGFYDYEDMFDETKHARALSDQLGIENYSLNISAQSCFDNLEKIQYHMDEPQSNPSAVPLYFLAQLASQHVTVVLSGEGADELFGGYAWYESSKATELYNRLPFGLRRLIANAVDGFPASRTVDFLKRGGKTVEERFIGQAKVFEEDEAVAVLKAPYKNGPSLASITSPVYDEVKNEDDLTKMQFLDLNLWLPGDILLKADKMSMAHSIELRVPFLDKEVMKFAGALPPKHRVDYKETKKVLRHAAANKLPQEWANRPKVGFPVPIRNWLREETYYTVVKDVFTSPSAAKFFNQNELLGYLDKHYKNEGNYARRIWTVYVFLIWYKAFFE